MEVVIEILLEVLGDFALELGFAALNELATHRAKSPVLTALSALFLGGLVGFVSLWPLPHHLIHSQTARMVSLVCSPLFAGALLGMRGWMKAVPRFGWRSFVSGVLLAGTLGAVRFLYAT